MKKKLLSRTKVDTGHFAMPFAIFLFIFSVVSFFLLPQIVWFYTWIFSDNKLYEFVCKTPMPW